MDYHSFGLTSLLDATGVDLPAGIEATYATIASGAVATAAETLAGLPRRRSAR